MNRSAKRAGGHAGRRERQSRRRGDVAGQRHGGGCDEGRQQHSAGPHVRLLVRVPSYHSTARARRDLPAGAPTGRRNRPTERVGTIAYFVLLGLLLLAPPDVPCSLLVAAPLGAPFILQSAGSVACLLLSQRSPMFLLPDLVAAGVLVAFSWAVPDALMCDSAFESPVDFDVPLVSVLEVELGVDDVDAAPFVAEDAPLEGFVELLLYVDEVVAPLVAGAALRLCMSPSASAVPLVSTKIDEKKMGASLRIWAS